MPVGEVSTDHILNVPLLSTKLAKAAWYNTFWAKLANFQGITRTNGIRQTNPAQNVVVQMLNDFVEEGRDNMLMSMIMPLTEDPVYGDTWLKGTGETLSLRHLRVYINQVRKAVTKSSGNMSNQRLKHMNLMKEATPALIEYWSKWFNAALFMTMYEGISPEISNGKNDQGVGMKVRYHPNMYYAGTASGSKVTMDTVGTEFYTKTDAQWASADSKVLGALDSYFITLMNMKIKSDLLIEPILTDLGDPFWLWLVHPQQFRGLKTESNIVSMQNSAFTGELRRHPAVRGKDFLYYDGFCIIEEQTGVRTASKNSATSLATQLADTNGWMKPPTNGARCFGSMILGRDALGLGVAENLRFTEEKDDHENVWEIGTRTIRGANRADFFKSEDEASVYDIGNATKTIHTTAYEAINQSSLIAWTL